MKADGLAAGKGVFVCESPEEAARAIDELMGEDSSLWKRRAYGAHRGASQSDGSYRAHAFTDGVTVIPMPFACDYKRIGDGDEGPNTGGMGAYSPPLWLDEALEPFIHERITEAAIQAMARSGTPYKGVLYPGLMINEQGPQVIEFNCRMGDPETQVLLPRLKSDLLDILWAVANERLAEAEVQWSTDACVAVTIASGGYPGEYQTGFPIAGLGSIEPDVMVFHAGTAISETARW